MNDSSVWVWSKKEATITKKQKRTSMSRTMYGLYFQGSVRVVFFCSKVPSLAFTDLKPKDVLDSATERKKQKGEQSRRP